MARINKCWPGCGEIGTLYTAGGMKVSTTTMESSMEGPQKTRDRPAIHPVISLLGIYLKEHKSGYNIHLYTDVHPSTIHNSQTTETTQCPTTDESIKKM
jgi:hypothetical protein